MVVTPRRSQERLRTILMLLIGALALFIPFASFISILRLSTATGECRWES